MALTTFYKRPSSEYNSATYGTSIFSCSDTGEAYLFGSKIKIKWEDVINPPTIGSAVAWDDITGKPSWIDSSTKPSYNWSEIGGKPSTFTPSAHTHSISDVTDLQVALNDKVSLSSDAFKPNNMCWGGTTTDGTTTCLAFINPDNFALFGHTSLPLRLRSSSNPTVLVGTNTYTLLHTGNIGSITFTGAVSGTYDGTNNISVNIPTAGGGVADSVDWSNVTNKPTWIGSTKPTYSYSEITGTIPIADIPTGTTSSTVALGNHTHNQYLTSIPAEYITQTELNSALADYATTDDIPSLSGYATQSWVQSQGYITTAYTLPTASASTLGGIKVGAGLSISSAGVLSATGGGVADAVDWDNITSKPSWVNSTSKPTYTWSEISGKPSWIGSSKPTYAWSEITSKPTWIGTSKPTYSYSEISGTVPSTDLPIATADTVGVIRVGAGLSINSLGVLSATGGGTADAVDLDNVTGMNSTWKTLLASAPTRYVTSDPTWAQVTGKPTFATVATSGSYNDLTNKPTIPSLSGYATQSWVTSQINAIDAADVGAASASHTHGTDDVTALTGYTEGSSTTTLSSSMTLNAALASLQNQIQAKANSSHTHTISQVTGMGTLTFTGAATGTYNGSGNLTINIPEGSSIDTSNFVTLNGTQTITGTKTFTQYTVFSNGAGTSSDKRLKRSIKPLENPFEILEGLTGYRYTLISNNAKSVGLIAQDVEKVLPEAVRTDDEGYKSVDTYPIVAVLVETIKELKKEIEELKSKL